MWIVLLLILGVYAWRDVRKKTLPIGWLTAGIALAVVFGGFVKIREESVQVWAAVLYVSQGMVPGMLFTLLAWIMKGKIGYGDGLVLVLIGGLLGMEQGLVIWSVALGMSFVYSCILLVACKKKKEYCFPFVPFYFWGTLCVWLVKRM